MEFKIIPHSYRVEFLDDGPEIVLEEKDQQNVVRIKLSSKLDLHKLISHISIISP